MPRYFYTVSTHPNTQTTQASFVGAVKRILGHDTIGWHAAAPQDISFHFLGTTRPDVDWDLRPTDVYLHVILVPASRIATLFPSFEDNNMSVCDMRTRVCFINEDRWLRGSPEFRGDMATYRHYVINHEVGHAMGCGHLHLTYLQRHYPAGSPCPVMVQQTKGHGTLAPNGHPTPRDLLLWRNDNQM